MQTSGPSARLMRITEDLDVPYFKAIINQILIKEEINMKVITTVKFKDLESNKIREINDVFDVSKERAKVLIENNVAKEFIETASIAPECEKATQKVTKSKRNSKSKSQGI